MPRATSPTTDSEQDLDQADTLYTRRGVLGRSILGITSVGLAGFLAACGNDDEDDDSPDEQEGAGEAGGDSDPDESSDMEEETGIEGDEEN